MPLSVGILSILLSDTQNNLNLSVTFSEQALTIHRCLEGSLCSPFSLRKTAAVALDTGPVVTISQLDVKTGLKNTKVTFQQTCLEDIIVPYLKYRRALTCLKCKKHELWLQWVNFGLFFFLMDSFLWIETLHSYLSRPRALVWFVFEF